jgi:predicted nucleotidyltransferase
VSRRGRERETLHATLAAVFFEEVLVLLRDAGVRCVIVGGTAVILHGVPRTTADLDLVVDLEPSNLRRLISVMNRLGYTPRVPVDALALADDAQRQSWIDDKGMRAFTFQLAGHALSDIDILIDSPISFTELAGRAERVDAGGLMLLVAGIDDLIAMKVAAGREQDLADADALRRLKEDRRA